MTVKPKISVDVTLKGQLISNIWKARASEKYPQNGEKYWIHIALEDAEKEKMLAAKRKLVALNPYAEDFTPHLGSVGKDEQYNHTFGKYHFRKGVLKPFEALFQPFGATRKHITDIEKAKELFYPGAFVGIHCNLFISKHDSLDWAPVSMLFMTHGDPLQRVSESTDNDFKDLLAQIGETEASPSNAKFEI